MSTIQEILSFSQFLVKFREVEREIHFSHHVRKENDAEHSWHLAMMARYVISTRKLNHLSLEKIIMYSLIHDLVEIYGGDTSAFTSTIDQKQSKQEREEKALQQMKSEFPEFASMMNAIDTYERREDEESKFVYALDKVVSPIIAYNDDWHTFRMNNVAYTEWRSYKDPKIGVSPEVDALRKEFIHLVEPRKEQLFPRP